jgi:hypothetical protein
VQAQTWFVFPGRACQLIRVYLGVPKIERLRGFRPMLAMLGPGMQSLQLPVEVPLSTGQLFPATMKEEFHEHVTGTRSWILVREDVILPEQGRYYVLGFAASEVDLPEKPKLWLSIGHLERFTLKDIFSIFSWRRYIRSFHELD